MIDYHPKADEKNRIQGKNYRITVLTECLLRLEYSPEQRFEDRATQTVVNRDFPVVDYKVTRKNGRLNIQTAALLLSYDEQEFSSHGLSIEVKDKETHLHDVWYYGKPLEDLGGTARTLDNVDGSQVELEHGIISKQGYSVLDDSCSLAQTAKGWFETGNDSGIDLYFFGYGHDYLGAIKDYYYLCGKMPMLPRYALGNWWSRYYPYSQEEYLELMKKFAEKRIPFSVAVLDMDWHLVDIDPKYGSGWTGFTWNQELFPEHEAFMKELHQEGMKVTLNLHPSDGIRGFEGVYPVIGEHMQVDQELEEPVHFDVSNAEFLRCYFQDVLHPMEKEGVDFWWIDWQQGNCSRIKNLDPLWVLNHYHYTDHQKDQKRALILSRYAGPGSHRYPVGFSGDTIVSWESLQFQPYFTSTASNIGYSWWSHDIGGHMFGYKEEELLSRWIQFGVFSPIMRLHSANCVFNRKEPWKHTKDTEEIMEYYLRLRHRLIPYIYTMNWRNYKEGVPFIQPLYYQYQEKEEAYSHENEYFFGSQLLVMPVTSKTIKDIHRAKETVWLPEGIWYDIFSNQVYQGDRSLQIYRRTNQISVFAKAGAILPLTDQIDKGEHLNNPKQLHLYVYAGADGAFTLYEDDNESCDYEENHVKTEMTLRCGKDNVIFTVKAAQGMTALIPAERSYEVEVVGITDPGRQVYIVSGEKTVEAKWEYEDTNHVLRIQIPKAAVTQELSMQIQAQQKLKNPVLKEAFDFLDEAEISYPLKEKIYEKIEAGINGGKEKAMILSQLQSMDFDREIMGVLNEIITAYCDR
ncbi:MAG: glycoside hydrolase family 31 protein [Lachnospiraceae bacterium]|nr:glycoside hydrolase family 31 protein [Lachnospiraceae bacterium]